MKETKFTKNMAVGWHDRGLGHGDLGIIERRGKSVEEQIEEGVPPDEIDWSPPPLLARLEAGYRESDGTFTPLPVYENALLFAASPDLFAACEAALEHLESSDGDSEIIGQLRAALEKALPPDEDADEA